MKLTIKQQYILLAVLVVLGVVVSVVSVILVLSRPVKGEYFTGKITAEKISCVIADGEESIVVDGKKVITDPGNVTHRGDVGNSGVVGTVCDKFDVNRYSDIWHAQQQDAPDGGEELVGRTVEVYAAKNSDGSYTLQGSKDYYVK